MFTVDYFVLVLQFSFLLDNEVLNSGILLKLTTEVYCSSHICWPGGDRRLLSRFSDVIQLCNGPMIEITSSIIYVV